MKWKNMFTGAAVLAMVVLAMFIAFSNAAQPTVTVTASTESRDSRVVYNYSFATAIATLDTTVLYKTGTTPFYVGYLGSVTNPDSVVTLYIRSAEATVDSVRKKIVWQISYKDSPSTNVASTDWRSFQTDTADSSKADLLNFNPHRTGVPYKLRVLIIETDANKDATQTFTAELCFPKARSL